MMRRAATSSKPHRVLQVALSLNPGGTERLIIDLATRLHAEIPMAVCCLDEPGAWASLLETAGIPVTAIRRRPGFRVSSAWAIADAVRRHRATLIHAHHYSPFVYSCLAQLRGRIPLVFTEHGRVSDAGPGLKRRLVNRVLGRIPSRIFSVSHELADFLGAEGLPRTAISVLYNGIEPGPTEDQPARLRRRAELGVEADEFVVGTVARLDPVKDLATLLRAFALLTRDRRMTLMVVGDGPERGALEDLARDLGIAERVRFLGRRDDARDWLWACDAYVNSSISEGVSLTILEAMAASLPIVATRVGGTVEVVDAGSGRLVPARDPAALAEAIGALAASSAMRRTLGVWGRRRVDSLFNLERMVRDYRAVYVAGVH